MFSVHNSIRLSPDASPGGGTPPSLGSSVATVESELRAELMRLTLADLTRHRVNEIERILQNVGGELVRDFILRDGSQLPIDEKSNALLKTILARGSGGELGYLRDTISFMRELFPILQNTKGAGVDLVQALDDAVTLTGMKITYPGQATPTENRRKVRSDLTLQVVRAVAVDQPEKLQEAVGRMARHDGELELLSDFLRKAGSDSPYTATTRMTMRIHHVQDLPKGAQDELNVEWRVNSAGTPIPYSCRGASGVFLLETGGVHCAYTTLSGGAIFATKRQAMLSVYRNWRPEEYSDEKTDEYTARRKKIRAASVSTVGSGEFDDVKFEELIGKAEYEKNGLAALEEVSLAELEHSAEFQTLASRSPILARELQVYKELRAAIEILKTEGARLAFGEATLKLESATSRLLSDPGGRFLGWFERRIEEAKGGGKPVPENVRLAYERLADLDSPLPESLERFYIQGLVAWQALESEISGKVAFSAIDADIRVYRDLRAKSNSLPENHPARTHLYDFDSRLVDHRSVMEQSVVSHTTMVRTIEALGVEAWREQMNRYTFARYSDAFNLALEKLRWLVQDEKAGGWEWKANARGQSVPITDLKKTLYGVPVADIAGERQGALFSTDFRHLINALSLREFNRAEGDKVFFQALSIEQFEEMVQGVVRAARKTQHFDDRFLIEGRSILPGQSRNNVGESFADWKPQLITGGASKAGRILPVEELFVGSEAVPAGMPEQPIKRFREIISRLDARLGSDGMSLASERLRTHWHATEGALKFTGRVGLYHAPIKRIGENADGESLFNRDDATRQVQTLAAYAEKLVPLQGDLVDLARFAVLISDHPFILEHPLPYQLVSICRAQLQRMEPVAEGVERDWFKGQGYLTPREVEGLRKLEELRTLLGGEKFKAGSPELLAVKGAAEQHISQVIISLKEGEGTVLTAHVLTPADFGEKVAAGCRYIDPAVLGAKLAEFTDDADPATPTHYPGKYISGEHIRHVIPKGWMQTAEEVLSLPPTAPAGLTLRSVLTARENWIDKAVVHAVSEKIPLDRLLPEAGTAAGYSASFKWGRTAAGLLEPMVNFGTKHRGVSVLDLDVEYITACATTHLPQERDYWDRKAILERAIEVVKLKTGDPAVYAGEREKFIRWVVLNGWRPL